MKPKESPASVGLVGCGKMGCAIAAGLLDASPVAHLTLFDPTPSAAAPLLAQAPERVWVAASVTEVLEAQETIIIAVKPYDVRAVLQVAAGVGSSRLLVSIAAGLCAPDLRAMTSATHRVARVMPNTPALVREGCTTLLADEGLSSEDASTIEALFAPLGPVLRIAHEDLMDPATALAGSGPAFVALVIEALADAAVAEGLPRALAQAMAAQTVRGAASLASVQHPAILKDNVGSPGGTTMAGVCAAEQHGLRAAVIAAVRAACARSRQMRGS